MRRPCNGMDGKVGDHKRSSWNASLEHPMEKLFAKFTNHAFTPQQLQL